MGVPSIIHLLAAGNPKIRRLYAGDLVGLLMELLIPRYLTNHYSKPETPSSTGHHLHFHAHCILLFAPPHFSCIRHCHISDTQPSAPSCLHLSRATLTQTSRLGSRLRQRAALHFHCPTLLAPLLASHICALIATFAYNSGLKLSCHRLALHNIQVVCLILPRSSVPIQLQHPHLCNTSRRLAVA